MPHTYPDPLVIPPLTTHIHTIILLHGRGDTAKDFGPALLSTPLTTPLTPAPSPSSPTTDPNTAPSPPKTLPTAFPTAKFIFPTAAPRRAKSFNGSILTQWFDNDSPLSIISQRRNEDWQYEGLRATMLFLHGILRREVEVVGARNVVLGGLSQGCAAALVAGLLWGGEGKGDGDGNGLGKGDGEALGAVVGMCGWLPLRGAVCDAAFPTFEGGKGAGGDVVMFGTEEGDGVEGGGGEGGVKSPARLGVEYLAEVLGVVCPAERAFEGMGKQMPYQQTPVFLGHGMEDQIVPVGLGDEAAQTLHALDADVSVRRYEGLDHWYSGDMLRDLVDFLKGHLTT